MRNDASYPTAVWKHAHCGASPQAAENDAIECTVSRPTAARILDISVDTLDELTTTYNIPHIRTHVDEDPPDRSRERYWLTDVLELPDRWRAEGRDVNRLNPLRQFDHLGALSSAAAESPRDSRPPRLWSRSHCPNCGLDRVEYLSYLEFANRCRDPRRRGPHRNTVSRRVKSGRYWASATGKVPWCKACRAFTPEGPGVERPVEGPRVGDYVLTDEDKSAVTGWAEAVVQREFPRFEYGFMGAVQSDGPAAECFQEVATVISEAIRKNGGPLTQRRAEEVGLSAMKELLADRAKVRSKERYSYEEGSNRPSDT